MQKESRIEEGRAIHLARVYGERKRNFIGQHFGRADILYPLATAHSRFERLTQ